MDCLTNIYTPGFISQHRVAEGSPDGKTTMIRQARFYWLIVFSNDGGEGDSN